MMFGARVREADDPLVEECQRDPVAFLDKTERLLAKLPRRLGLWLAVLLVCSAAYIWTLPLGRAVPSYVINILLAGVVFPVMVLSGVLRRQAPGKNHETRHPVTLFPVLEASLADLSNQLGMEAPKEVVFISHGEIEISLKRRYAFWGNFEKVLVLPYSVVASLDFATVQTLLARSMVRVGAKYSSRITRMEQAVALSLDGALAANGSEMLEVWFWEGKLLMVKERLEVLRDFQIQELSSLIDPLAIFEARVAEATVPTARIGAAFAFQDRLRSELSEYLEGGIAQHMDHWKGDVQGSLLNQVNFCLEFAEVELRDRELNGLVPMLDFTPSYGYGEPERAALAEKFGGRLDRSALDDLRIGIGAETFKQAEVGLLEMVWSPRDESPRLVAHPATTWYLPDPATSDLADACDQAFAILKEYENEKHSGVAERFYEKFPDEPRIQALLGVIRGRLNRKDPTVQGLLETAIPRLPMVWRDRVEDALILWNHANLAGEVGIILTRKTIERRSLFSVTVAELKSRWARAKFEPYTGDVAGFALLLADEQTKSLFSGLYAVTYRSRHHEGGVVHVLGVRLRNPQKHADLAGLLFCLKEHQIPADSVFHLLEANTGHQKRIREVGMKIWEG